MGSRIKAEVALLQLKTVKGNHYLPVASEQVNNGSSADMDYFFHHENNSRHALADWAEWIIQTTEDPWCKR